MLAKGLESAVAIKEINLIPSVQRSKFSGIFGAFNVW